MATSSSSAMAVAAKLRDEALSAAKCLEDEASSLRSTNTERSQQLEEEAALLKSAAAAQERVRVAAVALDKERVEADTLEQQAATLRDSLWTELLDDNAEDDDVHSASSEAAAIAHLTVKLLPSRTSRT